MRKWILSALCIAAWGNQDAPIQAVQFTQIDHLQSVVRRINQAMQSSCERQAQQLLNTVPEPHHRHGLLRCAAQDRSIDLKTVAFLIQNNDHFDVFVEKWMIHMSQSACNRIESAFPPLQRMDFWMRFPFMIDTTKLAQFLRDHDRVISHEQMRDKAAQLVHKLLKVDTENDALSALIVETIWVLPDSKPQKRMDRVRFLADFLHTVNDRQLSVIWGNMATTCDSLDTDDEEDHPLVGHHMTPHSRDIVVDKVLHIVNEQGRFLDDINVHSCALIIDRAIKMKNMTILRGLNEYIDRFHARHPSKNVWREILGHSLLSTDYSEAQENRIFTYIVINFFPQQASQYARWKTLTRSLKSAEARAANSASSPIMPCHQGADCDESDHQSLWCSEHAFRKLAHHQHIFCVMKESLPTQQRPSPELSIENYVSFCQHALIENKDNELFLLQKHIDMLHSCHHQANVWEAMIDWLMQANTLEHTVQKRMISYLVPMILRDHQSTLNMWRKGVRGENNFIVFEILRAMIDCHITLDLSFEEVWGCLKETIIHGVAVNQDDESVGHWDTVLTGNRTTLRAITKQYVFSMFEPFYRHHHPQNDFQDFLLGEFDGQAMAKARMMIIAWLTRPHDSFDSPESDDESDRQSCRHEDKEQDDRLVASDQGLKESSEEERKDGSLGLPSGTRRKRDLKKQSNIDKRST